MTPPARAGGAPAEVILRAMREREAAIEYLAHHDELTGLANRAGLRVELRRRLEGAKRRGVALAVAVLDLDRFREINEALGHEVGDRLLLEVAGRLEAISRPRDLAVARLGGDEFAVVAEAPSEAEVRDLFEALRGELGRSTVVEGLTLDLDASFGVALCPDHGVEAVELLRHAEVAMYRAKHGHLGVALYERSADRRGADRVGLVGDLRRALAGGGVEVVFQPKLDLRSGEVGEVEALMRWRHPRLGEVPPSTFVPVAERTGVIREVTTWMLDRTLRQVRAWRSRGLEVGAAVNLSALDLHDPSLALRVDGALARHEVPPRRLTLEITESSLVSDTATAMRQLEGIVALGVGISIDDFGTGYSSLRLLEMLPAVELKIDRCFVAPALRSERSSRILRSIVELGHGLGLAVVAEGVESFAELGHLRALGCDKVQGFLIGGPLPARELERRLGRRDRAPRAAGPGPTADRAEAPVAGRA